MSSPPFLRQSYIGQSGEEKAKLNQNIPHKNSSPFNIAKSRQRRRSIRSGNGSIEKKQCLSSALKPSLQRSSKLQRSLIKDDTKLKEKIPHVTLIKLEHIHDLSIKYRRKLNIVSKSLKSGIGRRDNSTLEKKSQSGCIKNISFPVSNKSRQQRNRFDSATRNFGEPSSSSSQHFLNSTEISTDSLSCVPKNLQQQVDTRAWSADCIVCNEIFTDRLKLHKHATLSHSNTKIFFCDFCGKTFLREAVLQEHRMAIHKVVVAKDEKLIDLSIKIKRMDEKGKEKTPVLTSEMRNLRTKKTLVTKQTSDKKMKDEVTTVNTAITGKNIVESKVECSKTKTESTRVLSQISSDATKSLNYAAPSNQTESLVPILKKKNSNNIRVTTSFRSNKNLQKLRKRRIRKTVARLNIKASNMSTRSSKDTELQSVHSELGVGTSRQTRRKTRSTPNTTANDNTVNDNLAKTLEQLNSANKVDCTISEDVTTHTSITEKSFTNVDTSGKMIVPLIRLDCLSLNNPISNNIDEPLQKKEEISTLKRAMIRNIKKNESRVELKEISVELPRIDERCRRIENTKSLPEHIAKNCNVIVATNEDVSCQLSTIQIAPKNKKEHDFLKTKSCIMEEKLIQNKAENPLKISHNISNTSRKQVSKKGNQMDEETRDTDTDVLRFNIIDQETLDASKPESTVVAVVSEQIIDSEMKRRAKKPGMSLYRTVQNKLRKLRSFQKRRIFRTQRKGKMRKIERHPVNRQQVIEYTTNDDTVKNNITSNIGKSIDSEHDTVRKYTDYQLLDDGKSLHILNMRQESCPNYNSISDVASASNVGAKLKSCKQVLPKLLSLQDPKQTLKISIECHGEEKNDMLPLNESDNKDHNPVRIIYSANSVIIDGDTQDPMKSPSKVTQSVIKQNSNIKTCALPQINDTLTCKLCHRSYPSGTHLNDHMLSHQNASDNVSGVMTIKHAQTIVPSKNESPSGGNYQDNIEPRIISECEGKKLTMRIESQLDTQPSDNSLSNRMLAQAIPKIHKNEFSTEQEGVHCLVDNRVDETCAFFCENCPQKFITLKDSEEHDKERHKKCATNKTFKKLKSRKEYIMTRASKKQKYDETFEQESKTVKSRSKRKTRYGKRTQTRRCEYCPQTFVTMKDCNKHRKEIHLSCATCNRVCKTPRGLKIHEAHHRKKMVFPFKCYYCPEQFTGMLEVVKHTEETHVGCVTCNTYFSTVEILKEHEETHPACPTCKTVFLNVEYLKKHETTHLTCVICNIVFPTAESLQKHVKTHPTCATCNAGFAIEESLKQHEKTHPTCRTCNAGFLIEGSLEEHEKIHPTCGTCNAGFLIEESLKEHEKTHPICETCNIAFLTAETLKKHEKIHPSCATCHAVFLNAKRLNKHVEKHPTCATCNASFLTVKILKEHVETHPICAMCNAVFLTVESLQKHEETHPKCGTCNAVFSTVRSLKKHETTHPVCKTCNAIFLTTESLEEHEIIHRTCKICNAVHLTVESCKIHETIHPICKTCNAVLPTEESFKKHKLIHPTCKTCNVVYLTAESLRNHETIHPTCKTCKAVYRTAKSLEIHEESHPKCRACDAMFLTAHSLEVHEQTYSACKTYNHIFKTVEVLNEHETTHTKITSKFQSRYLPGEEISSLDSRIADVKLSKTSAKCNIPLCSNKSADTPEIIHEVKRCDYCPKQFISSRHLESHITNKHKTCILCKEVFLTINAYDEHKANHLQQTLKTCPFCSQNFRSDEQTSIHVNKEHKTCKTCGKFFKTKKICDNHQRIQHLQNIKPKCCHCPERFSSLEEVRNHTKKEHKTSKQEFGSGAKFLERGASNVMIEKVTSRVDSKKHIEGDFCSERSEPGTEMEENDRDSCKLKSNVSMNEYMPESILERNEESIDYPDEDEATIIEHLRLTEKSGKKRCMHCPETFDNLGALLVHQKKHLITCTICNQGFANFQRYLHHTQTHDSSTAIPSDMQWRKMNTSDGEIWILEPIEGASENTVTPLGQDTDQALDQLEYLRHDENDVPVLELASQNLESKLVSPNKSNGRNELNTPSLVYIVQENVIDSSFREEPVPSTINLSEAIEVTSDHGDDTLSAYQHSVNLVIAKENEHSHGHYQRNEKLHEEVSGRSKSSKLDVETSSVKTENKCEKQVVPKMSRVCHVDSSNDGTRSEIEVAKNKVTSIPKRMKPGVRSIEKVHTCAQCNQIYTDKNKLAEHRLRHHNVCDKTPKSHKIQAACMVCGRKFQELDMLAVHLTSTHGINEMQTLDILEAYLTTTQGIEQTSTMEEIEFSCSICKSKFVSQDMLLKHSFTGCNSEQPKPERTFCCFLCKALCKTNDDLRVHLLNHSETSRIKPDDKFVCPICNAIFDMQQSLNSHLETHDEILEPEKNRRHDGKKIRHKKSNSSSRCRTTKKSSPECLIIGETEEFLNEQSKKLNVSSKIFTCFICSVECKTEDALKMHVHSHGSKQCKICALQSDEVFQAHIDDHMLRYCENGNPILCVYCESKFDTMQKYKDHQREECTFARPEHIVTKRTCEICNKNFFYKELCNHKTFYFKPIFVKCAWCSETFRSLFTLILHRYECKLQDHSCKSCLKKFWSEVELEQHIVEVHRVIARACAFCDVKFESVINLRNHERDHIVHDEAAEKKLYPKGDQNSGKLKTVKYINDETYTEKANSAEYENVYTIAKEKKTVIMETDTSEKLQNVIQKNTDDPTNSWIEEVSVADYHSEEDLCIEEVTPPVRKKAKKIGFKVVTMQTKNSNTARRIIGPNPIQNLETGTRMSEKLVDNDKRRISVDAMGENSNRAIDLIKEEGWKNDAYTDDCPAFKNTPSKLLNEHTKNKNNSDSGKLVKYSSDLSSALDDSGVSDRRWDESHDAEIIKNVSPRENNSASDTSHSKHNCNKATEMLVSAISVQSADNKDVSIKKQLGNRSKSISIRNIAIQRDENVEAEVHEEKENSHEIESVIFLDESEHSMIKSKDENQIANHLDSNIFDGNGSIRMKLKKSTDDESEKCKSGRKPNRKNSPRKRKSIEEPTPFSTGISHKKSYTENTTAIEEPVKYHSCKTCGKQFQTQKSLNEHRFYLHDETVGEIESDDLLILSSTMDDISVSQMSEEGVSKADDASNFSSAELLMDWSDAESIKQTNMSATNEIENSKPQVTLELDRRDYNEDSYTGVVMCERCGKTFDGNMSLEKHKSVIHETKNKRVWGCRYCKDIFESLHECHLHRYIAHEDESSIHICENCDQILTSVAMVNVHICNGVLTWYCKPCDQNFKTGMELKTHNTKLHMEHTGPHNCDICSKIFMTNSMLERHKTLKHINVKCKSCQVTFLIKEAFDQHSCGEFETEPEDTVEAQQVFPSVTQKVSDQQNCGTIDTGPDDTVETQQVDPSVTPKVFDQKNCTVLETEPVDTVAVQQAVTFVTQKAFDKQKTETVETEPKATIVAEQVVISEAKKAVDRQKCETEVTDPKAKAVVQQSHKNTILECEECGEGFRAKTSLKRHILQLHKITPLVCSICKIIFVHSESLDDHRCGSTASQISLKAATDPANTWCQLCQKYFVYGLARHMYRVHEDESEVHVCENCGRILISVSSVNTHNCRTVTSWYCKRCCSSFSSAVELTSHNIKIHYEVPGPYQCTKCQKVFITKAMLYRHERWRHGLFDCDLCKATFITQSARDAHKCQISSIEAEAERLNKAKLPFCEICNKTFTSQAKLKTHNRRVHQCTPQVCENCNIIFMLPASLKEHMSTVHEISDITKKRTANKQQKTMSTTNDGSMTQSDISKSSDLSCEVCGMHSESEQHLKLHKYHMHAEGIGKRVTVQEITKFVATCSSCDKGFVNLGSLRCHQFWLHDTDCLICNTEFESSRLAANHKIEIHGGLANYMRETKNIPDYIVSGDTVKGMLNDKNARLETQNESTNKINIATRGKTDVEIDVGVHMKDFESEEKENDPDDTSAERQTQDRNSSESQTNDIETEICELDTICASGNNKEDTNKTAIAEMLSKKHHDMNSMQYTTYEKKYTANKIMIDSFDRNSKPTTSLSTSDREQLSNVPHCKEIEQSMHMGNADIVPRVIVLTEKPKAQLINEADVFSSQVDVDSTSPMDNLLDSFLLDQQIGDTDTIIQDQHTQSLESLVDTKNTTYEPYVTVGTVTQSTFGEKVDCINPVENLVKSRDDVSGLEQSVLNLSQSTVEELEMKLEMGSMLNLTLQLDSADSSESVVDQRDEIEKIALGNSTPYTESKTPSDETVKFTNEKNVAGVSNIALEVITQSAESLNISQESKRDIVSSKITSSHNSSATEIELPIRGVSGIDDQITNDQIITTLSTEDATCELDTDYLSKNRSNFNEVKEILKPLVEMIDFEHTDKTSATICLQSNIVTCGSSTFDNEIQSVADISNLSGTFPQTNLDTTSTARQSFGSLVDIVVPSEMNLQAQQITHVSSQMNISQSSIDYHPHNIASDGNHQTKYEADNNCSSSSFLVEDCVKSADDLKNSQNDWRIEGKPSPLKDNDQFCKLQTKPEMILKSTKTIKKKSADKMDKNDDEKARETPHVVEGRTDKVIEEALANDKRENLINSKIESNKSPNASVETEESCLPKDLVVSSERCTVRFSSIKNKRKKNMKTALKYDIIGSSDHNISGSKRRSRKQSHRSRGKVARDVVRSKKMKIDDVTHAADANKPSTSKKNEEVRSNVGMLVCPYCQKLFSNKDSYYGHMSDHLDSII